MRNYCRVFVALWVMLIASVNAKAGQLWDFSSSYATDSISTTDAKISISEKSMVVQTGHKQDWPGVTLTAPNKTWNLSEFLQVSLDVENLSAETVKIHMRVDDPKGDGAKHSITSSIEISPGRTGTLTTKVHSTPWAFKEPLELIGMRGYPDSQKVLDSSKICRVIIFLAKPQKDYTFRIKNLRAEGSVIHLDSKGFVPFIDKFGQFVHTDWPGKIDSERTLIKVRKREQKELLAQVGPGEWDKYGGWAKGPKLKASGFFRVEKQNGQWWLVDPDGHLFWSHGSDCVGIGAATPITDRKDYYDWLPEDGSSLADSYGHGTWAPHGYYKGKGKYKTFDFSRCNLKRKYGTGYYNAYALLCHKRLRSWGMNTIGNWSEEGVYLKRKTPYVASIHFASRNIEGSEGYWGKFFDVFAPEFRQALAKRLDREKGKSINDPWCMGFFVHNELGWGNDTSLAMAALMSPADQPAKIKFVAVLKEKYGKVEKLNEAWGASYSSWDGLLESKAKPDIKKARSDLKDFYVTIAETYFKTIRDELRATAPKQLYLGCRFAWVNDSAAKAAVKYCDVVSYNRYTHSVEELRLPDKLDKPIIIGEFHFGALDRGMFHTGLVPCSGQADRADKYRKYVFGALRNPHIIGTHWFQFRDQATTGRGDGENYQIGLLDICDTPYPETIDVVRQVGYGLYDYRYNTSQPASHHP